MTTSQVSPGPMCAQLQFSLESEASWRGKWQEGAILEIGNDILRRARNSTVEYVWTILVLIHSWKKI